MKAGLSKKQEQWMVSMLEGVDAIPISVFGHFKGLGYAERIPERAQPKKGYSAARLTEAGRAAAAELAAG